MSINIFKSLAFASIFASWFCGSPLAAMYNAAVHEDYLRCPKGTSESFLKEHCGFGKIDDPHHGVNSSSYVRNQYNFNNTNKSQNNRNKETPEQYRARKEENKKRNNGTRKETPEQSRARKEEKEKRAARRDFERARRDSERKYRQNYLYRGYLPEERYTN